MNNYGDYMKGRIYFDTHGHDSGLLPFLWRAASLFRMPKDRSPRQIIKAGLTGGVLSAIGDPASYGIRGYTNSPELIIEQIEKLILSVKRSGAQLFLSPDDIRKAHDQSTGGFILGVEGCDFLDDDFTAVDTVYQMGVRLLAPMHYNINSLGSVGLGWRGRLIKEEERTGLTGKGRDFVSICNRRGIIIDLSHADEPTVADACDITKVPLICSHTGPRALQDFPRFISDEAMKKIAGTGGLVGIWPYFSRNKGTADHETFKKYALHLRKTIGAENICIGTDFNGVPGYMKGYSGITMSGLLLKLLSEAGFNDSEIEGIAGMNFVQMFSRVTGSE